MKTTIEISDDVFEKLRKRAAAERTTLRSIVESALRQFLSAGKGPNRKFKLKDGSFRGTGYAPGIREGDWNQIRDIIYENRGA
jgi:hypothetical protein